MPSRDDLPDAFAALAAMCKFMAVPKMEPEFYRRHFNAVEVTRATIGVLAGNYPPLEAAFRKALPKSITEGADVLREVVPALGLSEEKVAWIDKQMTAALKLLVPVVRDPELPHWLEEAKWAIEGQFHKVH